MLRMALQTTQTTRPPTPAASPSEAEAPPAGARLIAPTVFWGLALVAGGHAGLIALCVWAPSTGWPFSDMLRPELLATTLCGWAVAAALLIAPTWAEAYVPPPGVDLSATDKRRLLARACFAGAWQAAALGFFLLIAGRLVPLNAAGIVQALALLAGTAALAVTLAARFAQVYVGGVFFWAVCLPVFAYLLSEIFLGPTGSLDVASVQGPHAERLRTFLHATLSASPGTAAYGALHGQLPGGAAWSWTASAVHLIGSLLLAGGCATLPFGRTLPETTARAGD